MFKIPKTRQEASLLLDLCQSKSQSLSSVSIENTIAYGYVLFQHVLQSKNDEFLNSFISFSSTYDPKQMNLAPELWRVWLLCWKHLFEQTLTDWILSSLYKCLKRWHDFHVKSMN